MLPSATIFCSIAGAVEAGIRIVAEGIWDKFFRCQFGTIEITSRQAVAADIEIARYADRHRL